MSFIALSDTTLSGNCNRFVSIVRSVEIGSTRSWNIKITAESSSLLRLQPAGQCVKQDGWRIFYCTAVKRNGLLSRSDLSELAQNGERRRRNDSVSIKDLKAPPEV